MVQTTDTDKVLVNLEAKAAKLASQLAETRAEIARIKRGRCLIYGLPHELLENILYNCHLLDLDVRKNIRESMYRGDKLAGTDKLPFSVIASRVSRRWRDVAINNAWLWTTIDLLSFQPVYLFQLYLERSKCQCLDIVFCDTHLEDEDYIADSSSRNFIPLIPHLGRCRSITLRAYDHASMDDILGHLRNVSVPCLQYLEVVVDSSCFEGEYIEDWNDSDIFVGGSPVLASLYLRGVGSCSCWPSPSSLTDVELDDNGLSIPFEYDDFCNFLLAAVSLTWLTMRGEVVVTDGSDQIIEVVASNLLTLCVSLEANFRAFDLPFAITKTIITPCLRNLCLADMDFTYVRGFMTWPGEGTSTAEARYPLLRSLRMFNIYPVSGTEAFDVANSDYMEDFALATPSISHLILVNEDNRPLHTHAVLMFIRDHDAGMTITPSVLWPRLCTISTNFLHFELLHEVVSGRIAAGCPLRKLCLPSNTPPDELPWFSDQLEVEIRRDEDMFSITNF